MQMVIQALKKLGLELGDEHVRAYLGLALDAAQMGVWHWDMATNKISWNDQLFKALGFKPHEFEPDYDRLIALVHPDDKTKIMAKLNDAIHHKKLYENITRMIRTDNTICYLLTRGRVLYDPNGKPTSMIGVNFDITKQQKLRNKIEQKQEEMRQATRNSTISEITSVMAHELNQPLSAISMYTQRCLEKLETGTYTETELIFALKKSVQLANHAGQIVHRLKDYSQQTSLQYEQISIVATIEECLELIKSEIQHYSVAIHIEKKDYLPLIWIDKIQIQQVLINLIRNSIEATASFLKSIKPVIHIHIEHLNNTLKITLSDNGPGFEQKILDNLFQPYLTTKPTGVGIGLSICRNIIMNAHQGTLTITNDKKTLGAKIEITLPLTQTDH